MAPRRGDRGVPAHRSTPTLTSSPDRRDPTAATPVAKGYQATTIQAVATAADIDPAMVMRYFGNKEGLFAAAAEFDLRLPDLSRVPPVVGLKRPDIVRRVGATVQSYLFDA